MVRTRERPCVRVSSFVGASPTDVGPAGIVVTDLDASSDDEREEEDDGDGTEGAPKLPRAVLRALLRGDPAARDDDVPRMLLAGLLASPFAPLRSSSSLPPSSLPPLELASFLPGPGSSDEAMDVEQ